MSQNTLTQFQKKRCFDILNKLSSYHTSAMFAVPVDPERDNCPNYFKVIHHPMDLQTVNEKLEKEQYRTVEEWKNDVNQIWENAYIFNGKQSYIATLAKQLQTSFKELTENFSSNSASDWVTELEILKNEINRIAKLGPKPSGLPPQMIKKMPTRGSATNLADNSSPYMTKSSSVERSKTPPTPLREDSPAEYTEPPPPTKSRSIIANKSSSASASSSSLTSSKSSRSKTHSKSHQSQKRQQQHVQLVLSDDADDDQQQQDYINDENTKASTSKREEQVAAETDLETRPSAQKQKSSNGHRYSEEELLKLTDEINAIVDVNVIYEIIRVIKGCEPGFTPYENAFGEVEVEVSKLKHNTLAELRAFLDSMNNNNNNNYE